MAALGHTAGEAVIENITSATCTAAGSYDEVAYCTVCGAEVSRTTVAIPATGHKLTHVAAVEATFGQNGNIEYWKCENCGKYFADANAATEIAPEDTIVEFFLLGDVYVDGKINARDVIILMNMVVMPPVETTLAADMNGDGVVNARDVIILMNLVIEVNKKA